MSSWQSTVIIRDTADRVATTGCAGLGWATAADGARI